MHRFEVSLQKGLCVHLGTALVTGVLRRTFIPLQVSGQLLWGVLVLTTEETLQDETPGVRTIRQIQKPLQKVTPCANLRLGVHVALQI